MKLKEFLQPSWSKLIAFFIVYLLSQLLMFPVVVSGFKVNILSPLSYAIVLDGVMVALLMRIGVWSVLLTFNLFYQYVISCFIILLVNRIKNK